MNMKRDIFENNTCPFTVPDGYFDTLHERIMSRIQAENDHPEVNQRIIGIPLYRKLIAVAACILFIFAAATLYWTYPGKHLAVAESTPNDDLFQWLYASDEATLMAESLDIQIPENVMVEETDWTEEEEAIIYFLERDNINVAAILYSIDNETFLFH